MATKKAKKTKSKKSKKVIARTKMSDEQAEKFLKSYLKRHDLKGKEAEHYVRRHAATRLAALDRYQKKQAA